MNPTDDDDDDASMVKDARDRSTPLSAEALRIAEREASKAVAGQQDTPKRDED